MTRQVRPAGPLPSTLALVATLAVAGWLGLGGVAGPLTAPRAAAAERCVGVIVDARLLGGGVRTGCAKGDPGSGLEALTAAGFSYAFLPRQPGLVCQVDGVPACEDTSTTTYWSYWYRAKGSTTWVYSSSGAGSHDPAPGSTEAWVWQEGGKRRPPDVAQRTICPPAPASQSSAPSADSTRSPATRASSSSAPAGEKRTAGSKATAAGRTSSAPSASRPAATSTPPATPTTAAPSGSTPATSSPRTTAAAAGSPARGSSEGGAPWAGLAVGAGLVAALGAAAVARSRRGGP